MKLAGARLGRAAWAGLDLRGAELMAKLSDRAWQGRLSRLEGLETALADVAKLKPPRFFWLVPKPPSAETP